jgi:UDP-2,4-diacetamido-2,4,6-trideoxy-beta-L-altropyranose hydrolase
LETKLVVGTAPGTDLLPTNNDFQNSIELIIGSHDMVRFEAWADIAVSAAGSTCWEFCTLGLPSILIDVAENQQVIGRRLSERGIAVHIPAHEAAPKRIAEEIDRLIRSPLLREDMSRRGRDLVDGRGAYRVVGAVRALAIRLRRATQDDCKLLWMWANDPVTRENSFTPAKISWDEHRDWFDKNLASNRSIISIAEESGVPIAAVRLEEKNSGVGEISITVSPEVRGFGLATHLIQKCVDEAARDLSLLEIHAFIKPENMASRRAFEHAGYTLTGTTGVTGFEAVQYVRQVAFNKVSVGALATLVNERSDANL